MTGYTSLMILQLAVYLSAYEIIYMEKALDFLQSFNITVKAIETLFPDTAPKLNRLFDAILTWARAYRCKLIHASALLYSTCSGCYMLHNSIHVQLWAYLFNSFLCNQMLYTCYLFCSDPTIGDNRRSCTMSVSHPVHDTDIPVRMHDCIRKYYPEHDYNPCTF